MKLEQTRKQQKSRENSYCIIHEINITDFISSSMFSEYIITISDINKLGTIEK